MNEPANFDTNKIRPWNWQAQRPNEPDWNLHCPINEWDDPPYVTSTSVMNVDPSKYYTGILFI